MEGQRLGISKIFMDLALKVLIKSSYPLYTLGEAFAKGAQRMEFFFENKTSLLVKTRSVHLLEFVGPQAGKLRPYYDKSAPLRKRFDAFISLWERNLKEALLKPTAYVILLGQENLQKFSPLPIDGFFICAAASFWTIGPKLEEHASQLAADGQAVEALILDALGTLALAEAKKGVRNFIEKEIATPFELYISEYYPTGKEKIFSEMLDLFYTMAKRRGAEEVSLTSKGPWYPMKSGFSLFLFSENELEPKTSEEGCKPCLKEGCGYFQIGGCHLKRAYDL